MNRKPANNAISAKTAGLKAVEAQIRGERRITHYVVIGGKVWPCTSLRDAKTFRQGRIYTAKQALAKGIIS